ncbi:hypothetical protein JB92DRAFT_2826113 [Gautieria morchelliformis]|nr:hypothetical protein JB92DRAFT_2826113 [Gautieria morchelliformis]
MKGKWAQWRQEIWEGGSDDIEDTPRSKDRGKQKVTPVEETEMKLNTKLAKWWVVKAKKMCCLEVQKVGEKRVHTKWKIWMQNFRREIVALVSKKGSPASQTSVEKDLHMRGAESRRHSAWLRGSLHTWARRRGGPTARARGVSAVHVGRSGEAGRQVVGSEGIHA